MQEACERDMGGILRRSKKGPKKKISGKPLPDEKFCVTLPRFFSAIIY